MLEIMDGHDERDVRLRSKSQRKWIDDKFHTRRAEFFNHPLDLEFVLLRLDLLQLLPPEASPNFAVWPFAYHVSEAMTQTLPKRGWRLPLNQC